MAKDHFLPAGFIGRFSQETSGPLRNRQIASLLVTLPQEPRNTTPANVAHAKNLYTLAYRPNNPRAIDDSWQTYEGDLHRALDELIDGSITAGTWLGIVVPFVAALLVRHPEFSTRFLARPVPQMLTPNEDTANNARMIELQRLLAPVMTAGWVVAKFTGGVRLITSELGSTPMTALVNGTPGIAIPLDTSHCLGIFPKARRAIIKRKEDKLFPLIYRFEESNSAEATTLNASIARSARVNLFASSIEELLQFKSANKMASLASFEPEDFGFVSGGRRAFHQFTWHRIMSALPLLSEGLIDPSFPIHWATIENSGMYVPLSWVPVYRPPYMPKSLQMRRNLLCVDISSPPPSKIIWPYIERYWNTTPPTHDFDAIASGSLRPPENWRSIAWLATLVNTLETLNRANIEGTKAARRTDPGINRS